ncbi:helix-turn-helix domain-containing protein [Niallia sp. 03190]|uniref:helix-turn-helix domain-containing protein n=1 Tax=Niallia sp. 03190 TaxID=3458061 RepID=UPI0040450F16
MAHLEIRLLDLMAKNKMRVVKDVATKADVHVNVLYKLLNGHKKSLSLETIAKLCVALDCEIGDLIVIKKEDGEWNTANR